MPILYCLAMIDFGQKNYTINPRTLVTKRVHVMNKFSNKVSWLIISFFMAAIIISFVLTGFQGFSSAPNAVATVDGTPVSVNEYQQVLNSKLDQFSRMFGGKSLTNQQIRQFRIKENALRDLINQKLVLNYVTDMNIEVSEQEVKETIKELPYFQTAGKFDVNKYKQILANYMSPSKFEERTKEDIKLSKMQNLIESIGVSDAYAKDVLRFKQNEAIVNAVRFDKEALTKFIEIPKSEIREFATDKNNEGVLRSVYATREDVYNTPEEIKARHILLRISDPSKEKEVLARAKKIRAKVTPRNFASVAKKETEETAGKSSGGDLGYFGRGKMVKQFEEAAFKLKAGQISEPVKSPFGYHIILVEDKKAAKNVPFEKVKEELAEVHLQKNARKNLNELVDKVTAEFEKALKADDVKTLERLAKKYEATLEKEKALNLYNPNAGVVAFDDEALKPIFKNKDKDGFLKDTSGPEVKMMAVQSFKNQDQIAKEIDGQLSNAVRADKTRMQSAFNESMLEVLEKNSKIVTYPSFL